MVQDLMAASRLGPGDRMLDFGCAQRPYEGLVPSGVEYVGADLPGNDRADIEIAAGGTVPAPDESFDAVLSTQVLEHVVDPSTYLRECARLLRPGGSLMLSTHGLMYYHQDPEDYWRWTSVGLALTVEAAGLRVAEQRGVLGLRAAALQLFQDATLWRVPRPVRSLYTLLLQTGVRLADRRETNESRVVNGLVIAVRAVRPGGREHPGES